MVTISVYGFDGESFLQRLRHADVRLLLDVRQRRGVRGPEYAWANSLRLQAALAQAGIAYEHHPELAPTTAPRRPPHDGGDRRGAGARHPPAHAPAPRAALARAGIAYGPHPELAPTTALRRLQYAEDDRQGVG